MNYSWQDAATKNDTQSPLLADGESLDLCGPKVDVEIIKLEVTSTGSLWSWPPSVAARGSHEYNGRAGGESNGTPRGERAASFVRSRSFAARVG